MVRVRNELSLDRTSPPHWVRWLLLAQCVLTLVVLSTGCAGPSAPSTLDPPGAARRVVRIGYQKSTVLLRLRGGLEERLRLRGARVEWAEFSAGPPMLEALSAGRLDYGSTGDTPPIFAQAAGSPLVYVAAGEPNPQTRAILVHADSPLYKVADLRGRKVAVQRASGTHYLLVQALERAGVPWEQVKVVYLAPADGRAAFASRSVDAWVTWDPYYAAAEEEAGVRVLLTGLGITTTGARYLSSRAFVEQNPDLLRIVLEAQNRVGQWSEAHPREAATLLAAAQGLKLSTLERVMGRQSERLVPIDARFLVEQQKVADTFWRLGLLPRRVDVRQATLSPAWYAALTPPRSLTPTP